MPQSRQISEHEHEWLQKLGSFRPETALPGFWSNLETNCNDWAREISAGPFWTEAAALLQPWRAEYRARHGDSLLSAMGWPSFTGKGAERIREKLLEKFRREAEQPLESFPAEGPPIPQITDLVRTRIRCKYLDGVSYLVGRLIELAQKHSLNPYCDLKGSLEGYFAQHIKFEYHVFYRFAGFAVNPTPTRITCEIQVGTELSSIIWDDSHPVYEMARLKEGEPSEWQWNPNDPRFLSSQLGHMLHLADGILMQLREGSRPKPIATTATTTTTTSPQPVTIRVGTKQIRIIGQPILAKGARPKSKEDK